MTPVRLEPAALRSRVKHSTTEPLRSLTFMKCYLSTLLRVSSINLITSTLLLNALSIQSLSCEGERGLPPGSKIMDQGFTQINNTRTLQKAVSHLPGYRRFITKSLEPEKQVKVALNVGIQMICLNETCILQRFDINSKEIWGSLLFQIISKG